MIIVAINTIAPVLVDTLATLVSAVNAAILVMEPLADIK